METRDEVRLARCSIAGSLRAVTNVPDPDLDGRILAVELYHTVASDRVPTLQLPNATLVGELPPVHELVGLLWRELGNSVPEGSWAVPSANDS